MVFPILFHPIHACPSRWATHQSAIVNDELTRTVLPIEQWFVMFFRLDYRSTGRMVCFLFSGCSWLLDCNLFRRSRNNSFGISVRTSSGPPRGIRRLFVLGELSATPFAKANRYYP